jgi:hypothetical protein
VEERGGQERVQGRTGQVDKGGQGREGKGGQEDRRKVGGRGKGKKREGGEGRTNRSLARLSSLPAFLTLRAGRTRLRI